MTDNTLAAREAACERYLQARNRLVVIARNQAAAGCPLAARTTRHLADNVFRAARAEALDPQPEGLAR